jgi:hypothetical protein
MRIPNWIRALAILSLAGISILACEPDPEKIVVHRDNCLVCHQPMQASGSAHGIEEAHPWFPISCVGCHGGTPRICDGTLSDGPDGPECDGDWVYDKDLAHVTPTDSDGGPPHPTYLKNLSANELDYVDPAYLRFINPGDFRVLGETCGQCHPAAADVVPRSTMGHTSGEITVARYRAGLAEHPRGIYGAVALTDPEPDPDSECSVDSLEQFNPPVMAADPTPSEVPISVAQAQEQYMVKACMRCHHHDFGENKFPGDFRSSGCTSCHMPYADNGLSLSDDPRIPKTTSPHPIKHTMTASPDINTCTHCHYRGGRIGVSYQGIRESAGPGLNPKNPEVLGVSLHGHDAAYYITDDNLDNDHDETPPDVHFEAGMHCVDCHTLDEVHGNGHLYADTQCAIKTECTDCHGTVRDYASFGPERDNMFWEGETLFLQTRVTDKLLTVPQSKDIVTPGKPGYSLAAAEAMGVNESGFSHTDELECYTCHAGWAPNCYGCHVTIDLTKATRYQTTGIEAPGQPSGRRRWMALYDNVLMRNTDGMIAPSMPAERFFMTIVDADPDAEVTEGKTPKKTLVDSSPRTFTFEDGRTIAGFGQRAFNPHTTRSRSVFMACDRCHTVGNIEAPDNEVLLDITHGFGSQRFPEEACDVTKPEEGCAPDTNRTTYLLDAIQTKDGEPLVVVGHPDPIESRPLTLEEIAKMRAVIVPGDSPEHIHTPIPPGAESDPSWPPFQAVEPPSLKREEESTEDGEATP